MESSPPPTARSGLRTVYADLDGTLLGPGGSLFAGPDGPSPEAAACLAAMAGAGVGLVLVSGRTREQMREVARALGASRYIAELGGVLAFRERFREVLVKNHGEFQGSGTPYEAIERSGAAGLLLQTFAGRLEPHEPWAFVPRECSVLLRGHVDVEEVRTLLADTGYGWLDLLDNGIIANRDRRFANLDFDQVHAYHLVPKGVNKRTAVALDRARMELPAEGCVAVGDSASDLDMAPEVGRVFIVANGAPAIREVEPPPNLTLMDRPYGLGFADAIVPLLG